MNDDDELLFSDDEDSDGLEEPAGRRPAWKVLIVDDEDEIHTVTKMVLQGFEFRDAGIEFTSAHSAAEAKQRLAEHPDIAVALVDVVMETDSAGLDLTRYVREEMGNNMLRIVLRTGQPGQAPERQVILAYDINDYKEKSELTAQKLFSTMVTAPRSYKDIIAIETSRRGLEKIIEASATLFQIDSMEKFLSGILLQIGSLLEMSVEAVLVTATSGDGQSRPDPNGMQVVAGAGRFAAHVTQPAAESLEPAVWAKIENVIGSRHSMFQEDFTVVYFNSRHQRETAIYIETMSRLQEIDHNLLQLFCTNASIGLDNLSQ